MANIKISGIVIAENNMGDYDKMLTILTPGFGKISCVAKGARRPQSALLAGTQLFCFAEYMMYKGTTTYHINSCETIEMFYNLRTDLDKLKYAIHINKIIQDITQEGEDLNKFSIRDNGFKCETCGKLDKSSINMSESTKNAIKFVVSAPAKKVFSFNLKDEGLKEFKLISKVYFNEKLEKEYKLDDLF